MQVSSTPFNIPNKDVDMVVVGSGPVGLLTAITTKIYNPDANIVVLEKYHEYRRNNPLQLDRRSFAGFPQDERIQSIVRELFGEASSIKLDTNKIENLLLQKAKELKIEVRNGWNLQKWKQLGRFNNAKVIVGADGAHSKVRELVFGDVFAAKQNLQFLAQVKYKTEKPQPEAMRKIANLKLQSVVDDMVTELPRKNDGSQETGSMGLLFDIDAETYEAIKDAKFSKPFKLEDCPPALQAKIKEWLRAREDDRPIEESIEISSIELSAYASQDFVKQMGKRKVVLVGDAAFGVPYFRSLNNGIQCSAELGKAMQTVLKDEAKAEDALNQYTSFVKSLSRWEILLAKVKAFAIRVFSFILHVFGFLPRFLHQFREDYLKGQVSNSSSLVVVS
jgi:2-polyprenyl-6-methoxyphenol hydroxylase-like FAD-dependent oxidoreductase